MFSFDFSGDDIEPPQAQDEHDGSTSKQPPASEQVSQRPLSPARTHSIIDMLATLPSQIAYNSAEFESPLAKQVTFPHRELFDVRMQLAAEDEGDSGPVAGLDDLDIQTNVYEGGFKSWECSNDLALLLSDRGPRKDIDDLCRVDHVIEIGCGTAYPSLVLFYHALLSQLTLRLTLADFNADVLRLVTLPNLLLVWVSSLPATQHPFSENSPNPLSISPSGELEITPSLIDAFLMRLKQQSLSLTLISGSWIPASEYAALIPSSPDMTTLVLASETIYSPESLMSFTEALVALLKRVKTGKALVAAKRVYFGVGGSVNSFKVAAAERGAVVSEIDEIQVGNDLDSSTSGVRRCIMEVQMM